MNKINVGHIVKTETRPQRIFANTHNPDQESDWHDLDGRSIPPGKYREVTRTIEDRWLERIEP
jgi:hypothetical protein